LRFSDIFLPFWLLGYIIINICNIADEKIRSRSVAPRQSINNKKYEKNDFVSNMGASDCAEAIKRNEAASAIEEKNIKTTDAATSSVITTTAEPPSGAVITFSSAPDE
jgi:hypothetical protein